MGDIESVKSAIKYPGLVQEAVFQTSKPKLACQVASTLQMVKPRRRREACVIHPRVRPGGDRAKVRPLSVQDWAWWLRHAATLCLFPQWC